MNTLVFGRRLSAIGLKLTPRMRCPIRRRFAWLTYMTNNEKAVAVRCLVPEAQAYLHPTLDIEPVTLLPYSTQYT